MDGPTRRLTALLAPLTNYERQRPDRPRWSLDGMRRLLALAEPLPAAPLVQIGGSKGKGTTAGYIEALARGAGLRTGAYASPHVRSLLERVRLDGAPVDEARLRDALLPIVAAVREQGEPATFFDVMTRAALTCFARAGVDIGLLEVGLGGRLDSTTAVDVAASIVTAVELEHTDLLGDTIEAIAGEKSHVLRPESTGFTSATGVALDVLRRRARTVGNDLRVAGSDFGLDGTQRTRHGWRGTVWTGEQRSPFTLPAAAAGFELPAFALAVATLRHLFPGLELPLDPAPRPALPGRFEQVACRDGGVVILDGAHTEDSMRALADELAARFPDRRAGLLFACAAGKRWQQALKWLLPVVDNVLVTALTGTRSEDPKAIAAWLQQAGVRGDVVDDAAAGLRSLTASHDLRVVTGSFYLVGAAADAIDALGLTR